MLTAISPVDGRYADKTQALAPYFSELGLIRQRVLVEVEYLIALSGLGLPGFEAFDDTQRAALRQLYTGFTEQHGKRVKEIEATTNHDVKAAEYFIREHMDTLHLKNRKEWVHFALTSQDINNTAVPMLVRDAVNDVLLKALDKCLGILGDLQDRWKDDAMLSRTHGQPASPTTMGKEIAVFSERLKSQIHTLENQEYWGKFGGATGNFNAHVVAFPDIDWRHFADGLLEQLGLRRYRTTTQIEHYDHLAALMHCLIRLCTILTDLCRDFWTYISVEYLIQKTNPQEVGSSTMPHKVNPIDFENAEGNLGIAIALFQHLATKLPVSRLQRDLTDSTVLRNVGVPFAHMLIALQSIARGLGKLELNVTRLVTDLETNWSVVTEGIQTILRREGVPNAYELLKELSRGNRRLTKDAIHAFIDGLPLDEEVKSELRAITPSNYRGYA